MKPANTEEKIVVHTSKIELEGSMSLASSYRFTIALLGGDVKKRIDSGETTLQAEIAKLESDPELMEKLSSELINRILISDDPNFRAQIIDLLDAVFGEVPEEHFVELETDTPRVRNRKRNNQINTIVAIFEAMRSQKFADIDAEEQEIEAEIVEEILDEDVDQQFDADDKPDQPETVVTGIPDSLAKAGLVDFDALPADLKEQVMKAIMDSKKTAPDTPKDTKTASKKGR